MTSACHPPVPVFFYVLVWPLSLCSYWTGINGDISIWYTNYMKRINISQTRSKSQVWVVYSSISSLSSSLSLSSPSATSMGSIAMS